MNDNNFTLIITGAGASRELGVPCGKEFLWEMANRLCTGLHDANKKDRENGKYEDSINQFLKYKKVNMYGASNLAVSESEMDSIAKVNEFREKFMPYIKSSEFSTIDYFLQKEELNPDLKEIGKFILAFLLIGYEQHCQHNKLYYGENWLQSFIENNLCQLLTEGRNLESVKFITFNYDRTIEHFSHLFLTERCERNAIESKRKIDCELEVIHVYDKIGSLPWQEGNAKIEFGARNDNPEFVDYAIKGVRLIGDRVSQETLKRIHQLTSNARRIYLIRFGYDSENMKILQLPDHTRTKTIGTSFGMDTKRLNELRGQIEFVDMRCEEFVKSSHFEI
jgi:hypothetical protein